MEVVRLEDMWSFKFSNLNWSSECSLIFPKFLADSTVEQYNAYINKYKDMCIQNYGEFPPQNRYRQASIADFLVTMCRNSQRPQSLIKMSWAAMTHYYDAFSYNIRSNDLTHFMQALVKHGTKCPQGRTPIPPIDPILDLFKSWGSNDVISIDKLRQKCITLLCITCMCRPSDLAPQVGFLRKQIKFNLDGSATILFFGIKNDKDRKGFEVKLSPASDESIDPVNALQCYLKRTRGQNTDNEGSSPVFRSLTSQSAGIGAHTVAQILKQSLVAAGLSNDYTARGFRAAGATGAVRAGCDPESTRQLGRWKDRETFYTHYVYPGGSLTDKILSQSQA